MKIEPTKKQFEPLTVTLETPEEVNWFGAAIDEAKICPHSVIDWQTSSKIRDYIRELQGSEGLRHFETFIRSALK